MKLIDVNQFDVTTLSGIRAKIAAGILNARIVADDESFPLRWRQQAEKTLELARSHELTPAYPFWNQDGKVLTVVNGEVGIVEFTEGEYHVRV